MDCQSYRNFVVIVEEGNLTAASRKLHIAQPALSNQLKVLETEYGARLLNRSSRFMELTDAGRILYEKAKHIDALESSAKKEIQDCVGGLAGTLRLGLTFSQAASFLDGLLIKFHKENPLISYRIYETETREILELVKHGVIEIGIARSPFQSSSELSFIHGKADEFVAVYHKDSSYAPRGGERISLDRLNGLPLCITRRFEAIITNACLAYGFSPNIICVCTQLDSSILWAKRDMCIAVVPYSTYNALKDDTLRYKAIDEPLLATTRSIIIPKGRYLSSVAQRFLEECKKVILNNTAEK